MKTFALAALTAQAAAFTPAPMAQRTRVSQSAVRMAADDNKAVATVAAAIIAAGTATGAQAAGIMGAGYNQEFTNAELNSMSYDQMKGTGLANRCQILEKNADGKAISLSGKTRLNGVCMQPKSIQVGEEIVDRKGKVTTEFVDTKLMTRETYTLAGVSGKLSSDSGGFKWVENDGIDYAITTVQAPGGERFPFMFTVKELVATGKGSSITPGTEFGGKFKVPSYRGGGFLDPKGRGMYTGYDQAVALPALQAGGDESLFAENNKKFDVLGGEVQFKVTGTDSETGELEGVFVSNQPGDTDQGGKAPKDILIKGIFYGSIE